MSSPAANGPAFPQLPLVGAGVMIGIVLLAAVFGSLTGHGVEPPTAPITAQRNLSFADRPDGAVIVTLADTNQVLDVLTGQNGFLRGTLRGFARTRRMDGIGSTPPLRLTGYADGRLMLVDPQTGRPVELEAFGSANEAVFVRLLTMQPPTAPAAAQGHS
jgi:putative photosynthetic complex assembly protein